MHFSDLIDYIASLCAVSIEILYVTVNFTVNFL